MYKCTENVCRDQGRVMTAKLRRKRDPEGRRLAIVDAAAELIIEIGGSALTHRKVAARAGVPLGATTQYFDTLDDLRDAALRRISEHIDAKVELVHRAVVEHGASPRLLAELLHRAIVDAGTVRAESAVTSAAMHDPTVRGLARRWSAEIIGFLAPVYGDERATAAAVFVDGVMWHARLNEHPLDQTLIEHALSGLLGAPASSSHPAPSTASAPTDRGNPRV